MGRHSEYNQEIADEICEWLIEGGSLRKYCEQKGKPSMSTIIRWIDQNADFESKYTRAREWQAEREIDIIKEIADDASNDLIATKDGVTGNSVAVSRSKLRIDARMWYAEKLKPKKYGKLIGIDHTSAGKPLSVAISFVAPDETEDQ